MGGVGGREIKDRMRERDERWEEVMEELGDG
jgi:hypothetical protein